MRQILKIIKMLRPYWRFIFQSLLVGIMVMFLQIPGPYITKVLIDDVYPHKDYTLLTFILILGAVLSTGLGFTGSVKHLFWSLCGCQHDTGFQIPILLPCAIAGLQLFRQPPDGRNPVSIQRYG